MVTFLLFGQTSSDLILFLSLKLVKLLEPVGHKLINQSLDKTDSFTVHKVFLRYFRLSSYSYRINIYDDKMPEIAFICAD